MFEQLGPGLSRNRFQDKKTRRCNRDGSHGISFSLCCAVSRNIWYSQGTNVNTLSFQVTTLEFGHYAGARLKGPDLVHPVGTCGWVPVCTQFSFWGSPLLC